MKVANTVDLKNKTNELLREVRKGEAVIITYRGKPAASLVALREEDRSLLQKDQRFLSRLSQWCAAKYQASQSRVLALKLLR